MVCFKARQFKQSWRDQSHQANVRSFVVCTQSSVCLSHDTCVRAGASHPNAHIVYMKSCVLWNPNDVHTPSLYVVDGSAKCTHNQNTLHTHTHARRLCATKCMLFFLYIFLSLSSIFSDVFERVLSEHCSRSRCSSSCYKSTRKCFIAQKIDR